jgi:hypothetical protein
LSWKGLRRIATPILFPYHTAEFGPYFLPNIRILATQGSTQEIGLELYQKNNKTIYTQYHAAEFFPYHTSEFWLHNTTENVGYTRQHTRYRYRTSRSSSSRAQVPENRVCYAADPYSRLAKTNSPLDITATSSTQIHAHTHICIYKFICIYTCIHVYTYIRISSHTTHHYSLLIKINEQKKKRKESKKTIRYPITR